MATNTPMQLGMVGLGRMGANLVRRLMRTGTAVSAPTCRRTPSAPIEAEGGGGTRSPNSFAAKLERLGGVGDGARGRDHRPDDRRARRAARAGRHHHRRRQHVLPRRHPARPHCGRGSITSTSARAAGSGARARLLPDGRRRRGGRSPRADLRLARPRARRRRADAGRPASRHRESAAISTAGPPVPATS